MSFFPQVLTPLFGALISIATAIAGIIKFATWWNDRQHIHNSESAKFLAELPDNSPLTKKLHEFGAAEQRRIHFYRVTGLNIRQNYETILELDDELGKKKFFWNLVRAMHDDLLLNRSFARVRQFKFKDFSTILCAIVGGTISFIFAFVFLGAGIRISKNASDKVIDLWLAFSQLTVAISIAALLITIGTFAFKWASRRSNAFHLRVAIYKARKSRQQRRAIYLTRY